MGVFSAFHLCSELYFSFVRLLVLSLIRSIVRSFARSFFLSFIHSFYRSFVCLIVRRSVFFSIRSSATSVHDSTRKNCSKCSQTTAITVFQFIRSNFHIIVYRLSVAWPLACLVCSVVDTRLCGCQLWRLVEAEQNSWFNFQSHFITNGICDSPSDGSVYHFLILMKPAQSNISARNWQCRTGTRSWLRIGSFTWIGRIRWNRVAVQFQFQRQFQFQSVNHGIMMAAWHVLS